MAKRRRGRRAVALKITDFSDRELLLVIDAVSDADGVTSSQDVADALGVPATDTRSPAGRVSTRLSWMARPGYGQLERLDPRAEGRRSNEAIWRITKHGRAVLDGKATSGMETVGRAYASASPEVATAIRREWSYQSAQRSR